MENSEHSDLEEWAKKFGGTAILGFISTLLLSGKLLHYAFQKRGLIFGSLIIPPALLSGLIGLIWFSGMEYLDPLMTSDLRGGLEALKGNLIIFVFAALILGITCGRSNSQHNASIRGILTSLLHEGMPMVIYSQILNWGQTTCCLLVVCMANSLLNLEISGMFAAMVPLGLEAGADVVLSTRHKSDWTQTIVEEAESLGMMAVCCLGVTMFTCKAYFSAQGWLGKSYQRDQQPGVTSFTGNGTGQAEAFQRGPKNPMFAGPTLNLGGGFGGARIGGGGVGGGRGWANSDAGSEVNVGSHSGTPGGSGSSGGSGGGVIVDNNNHNNITRDAHSSSFDESESDFVILAQDGKQSHASLGAHLALIALTAFMSFGLALSLHLLEIELGMTLHWLSGVRMFKLAMCCAMLSMIAILQRTRIKFNRDWFMHMCGLMLDLLVIAALSKAYPKPHALEQTHYVLCSVFVLVCLLWNIFCFVFVAQSLFPNYWFERAVTLAGDSMGHSYTGLLFVRTLDPSMESPVPAAYAYKLILFFIPSSGAKQTIVTTTMSSHGPWITFAICLCVVATWLVIFDAYFRKRFVGKHGKTNVFEEAFKRISSGENISDTQFELAKRREDPVSSSSTGVSTGDVLQRHRSHLAAGARNLDGLFGGSTSNSSRGEGGGGGGGGGGEEEDDEGEGLLMGESYRSDHEEGGGHSGSHSPAVGRRTGSSGSAAASAPNDGLPSLPPLLESVHASEASSIISQEQMNIIASFLSESNVSKSWQLTYSLRQHGASLSTLLSLNAHRSRSGQRAQVPCVIVIEDSWGYVFGGFISPYVQDRSGYYGNGESFVFTVVPQPRVYKWTGKNELFAFSDDRCFAMGGGGDGYAVQLDDELDTGVSNRSDTFGNQVLSSSEFFKCLNVEVWALDMSGFSL